MTFGRNLPCRRNGKAGPRCLPRMGCSLPFCRNHARVPRALSNNSATSNASMGRAPSLGSVGSFVPTGGSHGVGSAVAPPRALQHSLQLPKGSHTAPVGHMSHELVPCNPRPPPGGALGAMRSRVRPVCPGLQGSAQWTRNFQPRRSVCDTGVLPLCQAIRGTAQWARGFRPQRQPSDGAQGSFGHRRHAPRNMTSFNGSVSNAGSIYNDSHAGSYAGSHPGSFVPAPCPVKDCASSGATSPLLRPRQLDGDSVENGSVPHDEVRGSEVCLNIYDLGEGCVAANTLCSDIFHVGGAFHVGVEVHGIEIFFGRNGVETCQPRRADVHVFRKSVRMGWTPLCMRQIKQIVANMGWNGADYDLLRQNCCSFASALCNQLVGRSLPNWVDRVPQALARAMSYKMVAKVTSRAMLIGVLGARAMHWHGSGRGSGVFLSGSGQPLESGS